MPSKKIRSGRVPTSLSRAGEPPRARLTCEVKNQTFRFSAGSGLTGAAIYSTDFMGLLAVATAATTLNSIIAAVKIRRIVIYSAAAAGANANCEVLWAGNQQRVQERFNTATVGTAIPATTVTRPPPGSDVSKWFDGSISAFVVAKITVPSASVIDLVVDFMMQNQIIYYAPNAYTGSSGLTTGYVYYGPLDRVSSGPGATKLNPLGDVVYYG